MHEFFSFVKVEEDEDLKRRVAEKFLARLRTLELKESLKQQRQPIRRKAPTRNPKKSFLQNTKQHILTEQRKWSIPKTKQVKAKKALADFIVENAKKLNDDESSKMELEVEKSQHGSEDKAKFLSPGEDFIESEEVTGNKFEYDDFTESFYSDENYPELNDLEILEQEIEHDNNNNNKSSNNNNNNSGNNKGKSNSFEYFQERTKDVPEKIKKRLSRAWLDQEVIQLTKVIAQKGELDEKGRFYITFGELTEIYRLIRDNLVETLMAAKKQKRVSFEGDLFLTDKSKDTRITLLI